MCKTRLRKFTKRDGYTEKDLLHYAVDHLKSAKILFEKSYELYDSAGYLSHLSIEMILKSMLLHCKGEFPGIHKLDFLLRILKKHISLTRDQKKLIKKLDKFEGLRYPNPKKSIEIGDEDWNEINSFVLFLFDRLPKELQDEFKRIDPTKKGGRILMSKPRSIQHP
jgi:HEPN domain-containing protein